MHLNRRSHFNAFPCPSSLSFGVREGLIVAPIFGPIKVEGGDPNDKEISTVPASQAGKTQQAPSVQPSAAGEAPGRRVCPSAPAHGRPALTLRPFQEHQ
ncbi:hypothetical protein ARTHRO9AX_10200 [Arthrobacter sp. 9AX]|nr:hypothetical protein ARTHRO9AX_10200 [Arthrobacter sp. 9AX]